MLFYSKENQVSFARLAIIFSSCMSFWPETPDCSLKEVYNYLTSNKLYFPGECFLYQWLKAITSSLLHINLWRVECYGCYFAAIKQNFKMLGIKRNNYWKKWHVTESECERAFLLCSCTVSEFRGWNSFSTKWGGLLGRWEASSKFLFLCLWPLC